MSTVFEAPGSKAEELSMEIVIHRYPEAYGYQKPFFKCCVDVHLPY